MERGGNDDIVWPIWQRYASVMEHALVRRIHNPKGRICYCDPDCWCRRTAAGRLVKWWVPARKIGLQHKGRAYAAFKAGVLDQRLEDWKREQHERQRGEDR